MSIVSSSDELLPWSGLESQQGRPMFRMELVVDPDRMADRFNGWAAEWIGGGAPAVGGELWNELRGRFDSEGQPRYFGHWILQSPKRTAEMQWDMLTEFAKTSFKWIDAWSPKSWAHGLSLLRQGWCGSLEIGKGSLGLAWPRLVLDVGTPRWDDRYHQFGGFGSAELFDAGSRGQANGALRFVKDFAGRCDLIFGCAGPADDGLLTTSVEQRLRRQLSNGIFRLPRSRDFLAGAEWLTLVPPSLGRRLGDVAVLRETGAFVEVEELPNGMLWLLATERLADYDAAAAERVFQALSPVMPPEVQLLR